MTIPEKEKAIARLASSEYEVSSEILPYTLREKAVKRRKEELTPPIKAKILKAGEELLKADSFKVAYDHLQNFCLTDDNDER